MRLCSRVNLLFRVQATRVQRRTFSDISFLCQSLDDHRRRRHFDRVLPVGWKALSRRQFVASTTAATAATFCGRCRTDRRRVAKATVA